MVFLLYKTPDSLKFDNRNLHNNVVIIFKQLKTVQNVYFSYLEAGDIGYQNGRISEAVELPRLTLLKILFYFYSKLKSLRISFRNLKNIVHAEFQVHSTTTVAHTFC